MDAIIFAPNSAIDSYYELDGFSTGQVQVAKHAFHTAGGKGFNMARALKNIGGMPFCLGLVGGEAGRFIEMDLVKENIPCDLIWGSEESRRCVSLFIPGEADTTVILERGAEVEPTLAGALTRVSLAHARQAPFFVLTGSLPNGFLVDFYANLVSLLKPFPVKVCLDASGEALKLAAEAGPALIKVNSKEFEQTFLAEGEHFSISIGQSIFINLQEKGLEVLIVTNGADGAYVFLPEGVTYQVRTQVDRLVSTAGSGDTFLAGLIYSLNRGSGYKEAFAFASAAAAANTQELGCGILQPAVIPHFLAQTTLDVVSIRERQS